MIHINGINTHLNKGELLNKFSQEALFQLAGFEVNLGYLANPLRTNNTPGCFFAYYKGQLLFHDFTYFFGKSSINCFEALEYVTKLKGIALQNYILENEDQIKSFSINPIVIPKTQQKPVEIKVKAIPWPEKNYYSQFDILPSQLIKEKTYLVDKYWCSTSFDSHLCLNRFHNPLHLLTIAYSFSSGHIKLYMPHALSYQLKWYSNCNLEDIWGIDSIDYSKPLIITKSGKDYLVLKYRYNANVIAIQSETYSLPENILSKIKQTPKQFVLFDNDIEGIAKGKLFSSKYDLHNLEHNLLKDPADTYIVPEARHLIAEVLKLVK
jgi:hypothetical protein